jgi:selenide,water dikinase
MLPGDDAAELTVGGQRQVVTTDHLRSLTPDPHLMARIAATHALGDIWAMGAEPQAAMINVTLPPMSARLQARTLAEVMNGAYQVLDAAGADIAGGHTSQGAEMMLGFTLTGLPKDRVISLSGARPGDRLIVTKPLGSGVILAGSMLGLARADWIEAAQETMLQPLGLAAEILGGAHAMTDVTGFGLAGHAINIARASGIGVTIDSDAIPLIEGAMKLSEQGVASAIAASNRVFAGAEDDNSPLTSLLFDPQTAGGLLAAVAAQDAGDLVARLNSGGFQAAIIGRFGEPPATINIR